jgi:hypothetical protein
MYDAKCHNRSCIYLPSRHPATPPVVGPSRMGPAKRGRREDAGEETDDGTQVLPVERPGVKRARGGDVCMLSKSGDATAKRATRRAPQRAPKRAREENPVQAELEPVELVNKRVRVDLPPPPVQHLQCPRSPGALLRPSQHQRVPRRGPGSPLLVSLTTAKAATLVEASRASPCPAVAPLPNVACQKIVGAAPVEESQLRRSRRLQSRPPPPPLHPPPRCTRKK